VYVPWINWTLMVSVLVLVFAFRSSAALAFAFGMAVTMTITITTLLYFYLIRTRSRRPLWVVVSGAGAFLTVDLLFVAANLTKLVHGAWLPLLIGVAVFTVMITWQRGRALVTRRRLADEGPLRAFVDDLHAGRIEADRVAGTAVFLNRGKDTAPLALRANVEHNHVLHEQVVILSVETQPVPYVQPANRLVIDNLGHDDDGVTHVIARFGFLEEPNVPAALAQAAGLTGEGPIDVAHARTSCPLCRSTPASTRNCPAGNSGSSSRQPSSPPTPPTTSACRGTARSSWARASRYDTDRAHRRETDLGVTAGPPGGGLRGAGS
jgi:KUP system potassium uptake protein